MQSELPSQSPMVQSTVRDSTHYTLRIKKTYFWAIIGTVSVFLILGMIAASISAWD